MFVNLLLLCKASGKKKTKKNDFPKCVEKRVDVTFFSEFTEAVSK